MPTYEYECTHCGHKFEAFQKMTDLPLTKCPNCGKAVKRLISSGAGIIFKGAGFYATDYRKKPPVKPSSQANEKACPNMQEGCKGCQPE